MAQPRERYRLVVTEMGTDIFKHTRELYAESPEDAWQITLDKMLDENPESFYYLKNIEKVEENNVKVG